MRLWVGSVRVSVSNTNILFERRQRFGLFLAFCVAFRGSGYTRSANGKASQSLFRAIAYLRSERLKLRLSPPLPAFQADKKVVERFEHHGNPEQKALNKTADNFALTQVIE